MFSNIKRRCSVCGTVRDHFEKHCPNPNCALHMKTGVKYVCTDEGAGASPSKDITKQDHYTQFKIQPAVFIGENNIGYFEGNVIKYVCRYQKKNGIEDLKKARHYLDMLISKLETGEVKV